MQPLDVEATPSRCRSHARRNAEGCDSRKEQRDCGHDREEKTGCFVFTGDKVEREVGIWMLVTSCTVMGRMEQGMVPVVVKGIHTNDVLMVRRITERKMSLKLEIDSVLLNVVTAYARRVGCDGEKKEEIWEKLDEAVELIPKEERLKIGADFNGHVSEGDGRVIGKYGYDAHTDKGQAFVDFTHHTDMAIINTFYTKRGSHKVTYTSGGRCTQIDCILCRRVQGHSRRKHCKTTPCSY
ncbi:craniofacial development protein 2-like [Penaeus indicus]|uniref:craniofacial development protein 2-like n=1 Tax=Penaeus indicus TaxID=29960 RepID=UPI00300D24A0